MSRTTISFLLALLPIVAAAQQEENTDTIAHEQTLQEVTVEATTQRTSANVTTYLPDRNAKRTAQNAIDLLAKMGIPQIDVNPIAGSVQTNSGQEVAIFIDYEPASQAEKDAINPQDVKKVEYLVYPTDPRFNHERYVIHIVLFHYDYGGYVKAAGLYNLMAGSGSGQVYAKMSHGKMTYDLSLYDYYTDLRHTGTEQTQVFRLPQADGTTADVSRSTTLDASRYRQNYPWASARAKYATEKTTISNTLNIVLNSTPRNDYSGRVVFASPLFATTESPYANYTSSREVSSYWTGQYYFELGRQWKLDVKPMAYYTHTVSDRRYVSDGTDIVTNATENTYIGQGRLTLSKTFGRHHTFSLFVFGSYVRDKVQYTGSTAASPTFDQYGWTVFPYYSFARDKYSLQLAGGLVSESNTTSGIKTNNLLPLVQFSASYAPSDKHRLEMYFHYNFSFAQSANKTPDVIQVNELLYQTGNPRLKDLTFVQSNISHTWLPDNKLSLSAYGGWIRLFGYVTPVFSPDGPRGLMLRTVENGGDNQNLYVGTSLTLRLLDRALVLSARPALNFEQLTGRYADTNTLLSLSASATYYLSRLYLSAYYSPAAKTLAYTDDATSVWRRDYYTLKIGWSNGKWNLSATAVNIFRSDWREQTSRLVSPWFEQTTHSYSASSHRLVSLNASYTFSFGKKISQGDELQNTSSSSSAIMK